MGPTQLGKRDDEFIPGDCASREATRGSLSWERLSCLSSNAYRDDFTVDDVYHSKTEIFFHFFHIYLCMNFIALDPSSTDVRSAM